MRIDTEFDIGDGVYVVERANGGRYKVFGPEIIKSFNVIFEHPFGAPVEYYGFTDTRLKWQSDQLFKTREFAETAAEALNK
ncbi:MAG: hypothetical protein WC343_14420 [Bacilli bacterium]